MDKENSRSYDENSFMDDAKRLSGRGVSMFGVREETPQKQSQDPSGSIVSAFSAVQQPKVEEPEKIDLEEFVTDEEKKTIEEIEKTTGVIFEPEFIADTRRSVSVTSDKIKGVIDSAFSGLFADYVKCELKFLGNPTDAFGVLQTLNNEIAKDMLKDDLFELNLVFTPNLSKVPKDSDMFHNLVEIGSTDGVTGPILKSNIARQISVYNSYQNNSSVLRLNSATKNILSEFVSDKYRNKNGEVEWEKAEKGFQPENLDPTNPPPPPLVKQRQTPFGTVNPNKPNELKNVAIEYLVRVSFTKIINTLFTLSNDEEYKYDLSDDNYEENAKRQAKRMKDLKISVNMGEYYTMNNSVNPYDFTIILEQIDRKAEDQAANNLFKFKMVKTNQSYRQVVNPYYRPY